jgi:nitroreductase
MFFSVPISDLIHQRYSCRTYTKTPIAADEVNQIGSFLASMSTGPFGTTYRFQLVAAQEQDSKALQGLGTYGLIKNPAGFIIGTVAQGKTNLEDFGYGMEMAILYATSLGLGTCWLGGNFTKSSFSRKIDVIGDETVPAVAAIGYAAEGSRTNDRLRQKVKSDQRLPWNVLFFHSGFENPLSKQMADVYSVPLEMVRLGPSAHNYQPWRVVQQDASFHFYLQRTKGFRPGNPMFILLRIADLQRMEIGIAMAHFELAAREIGLGGGWHVKDPNLRKPNSSVEYIATWIGI